MSLKWKVKLLGMLTEGMSYESSFVYILGGLAFHSYKIAQVTVDPVSHPQWTHLAKELLDEEI